MRKGLILGIMAVGVCGAGLTAVSLTRSVPREAKAQQKPQPLPLLASHQATTDSIARLDQTAKEHPGDPVAWNRLGLANLGAGNYDSAVTALKASLALKDAQSEIWSAIGEAYVHAVNSSTPQMPPVARAAFDKALALDPKDVRAQFYIALEQDFSGQHDQAITKWIALLRAVPAGSPPDTALRAAILASLNRHIRLVSQAVQQSGPLQPKAAKASPTG